MAWWPKEDPRFGSWRAGRGLCGELASEVEEEACYARCGRCNASLYVILQFRENMPERVVGVGREIDWPEGYAK